MGVDIDAAVLDCAPDGHGIVEVGAEDRPLGPGLHLGHTRSAVHRDPVIIYGAGQGGARLVSALVHGVEYQPVALIDDDQIEML